MAAPGVGHLLPAVPTAWAAQAAGHEVRVAATGPSLDMAIRLGLAAVEVSDGTAAHAYRRLAERAMATRPAAHDLSTAWQRFTRPPQPEGDHDGADQSGATSEALEVGQRMTDGILRVIRDWAPDLLVFTSFIGGGQSAADQAGVPSVHIGLGMPYGDLSAFLPDPPAPPVLTADVCPPSLRPPGAKPGVPLRFVPCNGGGVVPDWLLVRPRRPRICVTWGSVLPEVGMDEALATVLEALDGLDAEVVLAIGSATPPAGRPLPPGVRTVGWVPLTALLPGCAAVVHHGGSGSTFTALALGIPQVVMPHAADQPVNAQAVIRRGVGTAVEKTRPGRAELREAVERALRDAEIRQACAEVREEIAAMPGPDAFVRQLVAAAS
ncbi:nucleotide disphospho-sugar-binding domain-containing protein [Streptomyces gilvosporeus]|uniref:nucleotide disphospho-sugar-binding domain-containing protein n=1 Tax=Streptomyces gilvosporeus TaxID=553510 RepID=UPI00131E7D1C|nr:nucleotide disphospho-sugar-binding domain-containing protein [Streptomyces gilvosporeus]